jgi:signal transduction histidine kinase
VETLVLLLFGLGGGACTAAALVVAGVAFWRAQGARSAVVEADAAAAAVAAEREELSARVRRAEADRDRALEDAAAARELCKRLEAAQSEHRRREQSILEAQEAFLARMSHELRTPLNAVTGYCELLLEDADAPDLERIRIAAANLGALVTSVLDLSELQSGDYAIRPEVMKVDELVARAVDASRFVAQQQQDTIEVDVEPGLVVILDKRMLASILFHLVSNACKFTMKGTVRVRARSAQPNLGGVPTDGIELVISDTGIGMTPRQVEAAFRPFAQGDESFTRRYDGSGVGLAVVNGFATAMGGEVRIDSQPGAGATVTVRLPKEVRPRMDGFGDDEDTQLLR